jgi:hypothetical protein
MNNHSNEAQIAKKPILRTLALSMFALVALGGVGHAQSASQIQPSGTDAMLKAKDDADSKAAKDYINRMQTDEQYQKTIHDQPSVSTSNDPWGTVRPTTALGMAKPAAKSATKTASGATKPKPVPGAAASSGATTKGQ